VIAQHAGGETEGERGRRGDGALRVISWVLVHTLFTLRYARLYYEEPEGGPPTCSEPPP
jgi:hypothetical protein